MGIGCVSCLHTSRLGSCVRLALFSCAAVHGQRRRSVTCDVKPIIDVCGKNYTELVAWLCFSAPSSEPETDLHAVL